MTDKPRSQDSTSVEGEPEDAGGLGTATLVSYFIATPLPPHPPNSAPNSSSPSLKSPKRKNP